MAKLPNDLKYLLGKYIQPFEDYKITVPIDHNNHIIVNYNYGQQIGKILIEPNFVSDDEGYLFDSLVNNSINSDKYSFYFLDKKYFIHKYIWDTTSDTISLTTASIDITLPKFLNKVILFLFRFFVTAKNNSNNPYNHDRITITNLFKLVVDGKLINFS